MQLFFCRGPQGIKCFGAFMFVVQKKCCEDQDSEDWLSNLDATRWLQHLTRIIRSGRQVAEFVAKDVNVFH